MHFKCFRCEREWESRVDNPIVCRYCKNRLWYSPREILKEITLSDDNFKYFNKNSTIAKYFLNLSRYRALASSGLTQLDLSQQLGVAQSNISKILAKLSQYINSKRVNGKIHYSINFQRLLKLFMEHITISVLEKLNNEKAYYIGKVKAKDTNKKYIKNFEAKKLMVLKKIEQINNLMPIEVFLKNNPSLLDLLVEEMQVAFSNVFYEFRLNKITITLSKIRDIFAVNLVKYFGVFESGDLPRKSLQILFEEYTKIVVLQYY